MIYHGHFVWKLRSPNLGISGRGTGFGRVGKNMKGGYTENE